MYFADNLRSFAGTALRVLNDSLHPLDRLAAGAGAELPVRPLFVVGLPRSGTTLVYELLVQAFDLAFLTRIFSYTYGMPITTTRLVSRFTRNPSARYESTYGRIPGRFSPAENHVMWSRWFQAPDELGHYVPSVLVNETRAEEARRTLAAMTRVAGRQFVFKDVYFTMSPSAILKAFPSARVIVVQRDFGAVCASVLDARVRATEQRWWSISPPFSAEVVDKDLLTQTAFQCVRARQLLERELDTVSRDRCLTVDYEQICHSPAGYMDSIRQWVGGEIVDRGNPRIPSSFERRPPKSIPPELRESFERLCKALSSDRDEYLQRVDECVARRVRGEARG